MPLPPGRIRRRPQRPVPASWLSQLIGAIRGADRPADVAASVPPISLSGRCPHRVPRLMRPPACKQLQLEHTELALVLRAGSCIHCSGRSREVVECGRDAQFRVCTRAPEGVDVSCPRSGRRSLLCGRGREPRLQASPRPGPCSVCIQRYWPLCTPTPNVASLRRQNRMDHRC